MTRLKITAVNVRPYLVLDWSYTVLNRHVDHVIFEKIKINYHKQVKMSGV